MQDAGDATAAQPPLVAVVDLDGVLADVRHRLHHLDRTPKDWDGFFAALADDGVLAEGRAVVERLVAEGYELVYVTGRNEDLRAGTVDWLERHALPLAPLLMRRPGDRRPARLTKLALLRRLSAAGRQVAVVVDDDAAVVRALRSAGYPVLHAEWMSPQPSLFDAQEQDGRT